MIDTKKVIEFLEKEGSVAVLPTDTLYGIVARAADQTAVTRLYELKKREGKPGTIIASSLEQLELLGLKKRYLKAVEQYWPGSVSVVIPCAEPKLNYLHQGKNSLAVRIPDKTYLQEILDRTGPLLTSSANNPGEEPASSVAEAKKIFGEKIELYVDGGNLSGNQASTVIRIVDDEVEVLRQGAVKI